MQEEKYVIKQPGIHLTIANTIIDLVQGDIKEHLPVARIPLRGDILGLGTTTSIDNGELMAGGSFSNALGDFKVRAELGLSSDRYFLTDDPSDTDGIVQSSELSYVLGLDYQGWRDWFVSAQLFQSVVNDPAPGLVRDRVDTSATWLVRRNFLNEALQAEVLMIRSLNENDGVIQASLQYEWRTNIRLNIGADIFHGPSRGLFGQFEEQDRISLGIEFGL